MATKRKTVRAKKVPAERTLATVLVQSKNTLTSDEIAIIEGASRIISEKLMDKEFAPIGPCTVTQAKPDTTDSTGLGMVYRRVAMMGKEKMRVIGAYFGSRDGLIFRFAPVSTPLGMKPEELVNMTFEVPLKAAMIIRDEEGKALPAHVWEIVPGNLSIAESVTQMRARAEEEERLKRQKEAEAKVVNYGSTWGAF